jgi:molybdenum cofactor cytidylyltransferase
MTHNIAAIMLAAGLSSRMAPRNKLLTPMQDKQALIAHTARQAVASSVRMVIAVTGFQAAEVKAALVGLPVNFMHAADFVEVLAASLRAGIAAVPEEIDAAVIMLGDMPLVEVALIDALLAAYNPRAGRDIVLPVWQGQVGNPRLWGRRYFNKILSLKGDAGAGRLLAVYSDFVIEVSAFSGSVLRDFDTLGALDVLQVGERCTITPAPMP